MVAYGLQNQSITESVLTMMIINLFTGGDPGDIKQAIPYVLEYLWQAKDRDDPEDWIPQEMPQLRTIRRK